MTVSDEEARKLLERVQRAHAGISDAKERYREAVKAAMDAGVPRQEIADALGVDRTRLYQIIRGE